MGSVVGILEDLLRTILFFLDSVVYGLIPTIYKLFIYLSEINLYSDKTDNPIQLLVSHIYVLLGIFMLFKVSFSLLQYLVDPNAFRDSSKGMGKLVTNVLVALVLLVSVPSIFEAASTLQTAIVQSNAIGQLILGTNASTVDADEIVNGIDVNKVEEMATDLQFMLYGAFYRVNTEVIKECGGTSGVLGSIDMANEQCLNALNERLASYDEASANYVTLYSFFKHIPEEGYDTNCDNSGVCDDRNFGHFGALLHWREDGVYVIDYTPVISFLAGGYVIFLLISFSVDVAIRAIKLCFLQMVAPIAIVSYVDPKESISNGKLHNWIKECVSTYFSLFLRLATIFLVMLIIEMLSSSLLSDGTNYISAQIEDTGYDIWIYLFLVIGAFMFAKQIPKIIENIFGIKGSGELNLNPFKNAGFATLAGGAVGLGVGTVASGIAAGKTSLDSGENKFTAFRRALGGAASGGLRGGVSGAFSGGKGVFNKSLNVAGDISRNTAMKANTKFPYRVGAYVRNAVGAQSLRETLDQRAGIYEGIEKVGGNIEARARDQLSKKDDVWKTIQGKRAWNEQQHAAGKIDDATYMQNLNDYFKAEQFRITKYIDNNGDMGTKALSGDEELVIQKETLARNVKESNLKDGVYESIYNSTNAADIKWDDIDSSRKKAHIEAYKIKNSDKYEDASNAEKAKLSDLHQSFLNK